MNKLSIPFIAIFCIFLSFNLCFVFGNDFEVKLGNRQVFVKNRQFDLSFFPDQQLGIISLKPVRFIASTPPTTTLFEGTDFLNIRPVKTVLKPGPPHSTDNGYCGASSAVYDPKKRGRLLAFCHTEDHEGLPLKFNNTGQGFYGRVAMAESFDDGYTFYKIGPVITSSARKIPNDDVNHSHQGACEPCVILDKEKRYYLAYYGDYAETNKRGHQISVARCSVKDGAMPDKWFKYYDGEFKEPGFGGKDTSLDVGFAGDAWAQTVVYVKDISKYVMVYCGVDHNEWNKPNEGVKESGFYVCLSDDGIIWSGSKRILKGFVTAHPGYEFNAYPTLIVTSSNKKGFQGYLMYAYSERWGLGDDKGGIPHYLVGQPISFALNNPIDDTQKTPYKKENPKIPAKNTR